MPFFARWPGTIEPGTKTTDTICLTDFFGTVSRILGEELPDDAAEDSFSFLAQLRNEKPKAPRAPVIHHSSGGMFAIRDGQWKLVLGNGSGGREKPRGTPFEKSYQLFDLSGDLSEQKNIIDEHPQVASRLETMVQEARTRGRSR